MKIIRISVAFFFFFFLCVLFADEVRSPFLGINLATSESPPGVKILGVVRNSPAQIAGLEKNDVIIALGETPIPTRDSLLAALQRKLPGDRVRLTLNRCGNEFTLYIILGSRSDFLESMQRGNREYFPQSSDELLPGWDTDTLTRLVLKGLQKGNLDGGYDRMAAVFKQELGNYQGYYTLNAVALTLLEPAACLASGEFVKSSLSVYEGSPPGIWSGIHRVLDITDCPIPEPRTGHPGNPLETILAGVKMANATLEQAFSELSPKELSDAAETIPFLLDIFEKTIYIHEDPEEELVDSYLDLVDASKRIDYGQLISAGIHLIELYSPGLLAELRDLQSGDGANSEEDILLDIMVPVGERRNPAGNPEPVMGRMIVTGTEGRTYSQQAVVWIDLGGDDTYLGYCGGTPYTLINNFGHNFNSGRTGLHIDLGGDDNYIRNTPGSIGGGFCGAGILIDLHGNDIYHGDRLAQGSAFWGLGILIDLAGDDQYFGQENVQGFAGFGVGLLYDAQGNDLYHASRYAQGVGVTKGLGLLVECEGDDRYIASFKSPNNYGNEDTWSGWSKGAGLGFRTIAAGGIGLLADRGGNDYYEAGNFSQACGYFFGFGILDDLSGDDLVIGNRYTQGSGAHQAAGYFRDHAGNDIYRGSEAANQGGVWDIVSGWFVDDGGDDHYSAGSISQGGASQVAMGVFIDLQGTDEYKSAGTSNGEGGAIDYHPDQGGKNIGLFIDLGKNNDNYSGTGSKRKNGKFMRTDTMGEEPHGDGFFWDE
ncbi:PDZ domain-containing protein [bacterium]|nr:PDZ domain-containing protein [bacterium]